MADHTSILYSGERIADWLVSIGVGTSSTTMEGLLEDFAAAGGIEHFGYTDDDWKAAYDDTDWHRNRGY